MNMLINHFIIAFRAYSQQGGPRSGDFLVASSWTCRVVSAKAPSVLVRSMDAGAAAPGGGSHEFLSNEYHGDGGGCILWSCGRQ